MSDWWTLPFDTTLPTVHVRRWLSDTAYETKTIEVFQDDTILTFLSKIAKGFHKPQLPYAWHKAPVGFTLAAPKWTGYHLNPFKARDPADVIAIPTVVFDESTRVIDGLTEVHVVFKEDIPKKWSKRALDHYFVFGDKKIEVPDDSKLEALWTAPAAVIDVHTANVTQMTFATAAEGEPWTQMDEQVFMHVSPSKLVQFVGLAGRLYKVQADNAFSEDDLLQWTSGTGAVAGVAMDQLTLVAPFAGRVHAKASVLPNGAITIKYAFGAQRSKPEQVTAHVAKLATYLGQQLKRPIAPVVEDTIHVACTLSAPNMPDMKHLLAAVSKHSQLFYVIKSKDNGAHLIYKRCAKYKSVNIKQHIGSQLKLGIPVAEIVAELVAEQGEDPKVVAELIEDTRKDLLSGEFKEVLNTRNAKDMQIGLIITIVPSSLKNYTVRISNAKSLGEVQRALHWLRKVMGTTKAAKAVAPPAPPKRPIVEAAKKPRTPSSSPSPSSSSSRENALDQISLDDLKDLSLGGAGKKDKVFLDALIAADYEVFKKTPNYARKCGLHRQPVVFTKEEKAALDAEGYGQSYDSAMEYRDNVYMCPRIWCPVSRKPLSVDQLARGCPKGEEPFLVYEHTDWSNDATKPHYINFHTKALSPDGHCLPCCGSKPLTKERQQQCAVPTKAASASASASKASKASVSASSKPASVAPTADRKEETNLLKHRAPLADGRYGVIPKSVHDALVPTVAYPLCATSLSTQECIVRKGIAHQDDSFLSAVCAALALGSKEELARRVRAKLSPLDFMGLEHGAVLAAFAQPRTSLPKDAARKAELWRNNWPDYVRAFAPLNLQRELEIYMAFEAFLTYMEGNERKNPLLFYDCLATVFDVSLIVWERTDKDAAVLRCPYFKTVHDGASHVIMMLKDGEFYEPMEIKQISRAGTSIIPKTRMTTPSMTNLLYSCGEKTLADNVMIGRLRNLDLWMRTFMLHPAAFEMTRAILSPNMWVSHIQLKNGVLLTLERMSIPAAAIVQLRTAVPSITKIAYHDDLVGEVKDVEVLRSDANMFFAKAKEIGIRYDMGIAQPFMPPHMYVARLTVPAPVSGDVPTVLVPSEAFVKGVTEARHTSKKWRELARAVGDVLLTDYETLVKPLLSSLRAVRILTLMKTFPRIPQRKRLQVVLEEMPMETRAGLEDYVRRIGLEDALPYLSVQPRLSAKGDHWLFSQAAVEQGALDRLYVKRKGVPREQDVTVEDVREKPVEATIETPLGLVAGAPNTLKDLPIKWVQLANYDWKSYKIIQLSDGAYTKTTVYEVLAWMASILSMQVSAKEIKYMVFRKVAPMLSDEAQVKTLVEDPSFRLEWLRALKRSTKMNKADIWKKAFKDETAVSLQTKWGAIIESDALWAGDMTLACAAQLLGCGMLVILERGPYGALKEVNRGKDADLQLSSMFFAPDYAEARVMKRPFVILYKRVGDEHCEYSAVVDAKGVFMHETLDACSADVVSLVRAHLEKKRSE